MNKKPILALEHVAFSYFQAEAEIPVLKDISFAIHPGECVALVGPSGAGKSTLLHLIGLLEKGQKGKILLEGQDVSQLTEKQQTISRRYNLGFVYQFHRLLPEFTAVENVSIPLILQGKSWADAMAEAQKVLTEVGLEHRLSHRPGSLSGGEQQRVAIARAIVHQPQLLLADEPTGNLDPQTADTVFNILMQLVRQRQVAALIATHNMELAQRMDRIVRL